MGDGSMKVIDLATREPRRQPEGVSGEVTRTLHALRGLLRGQGDLVPDDETILPRLLGASGGASGAELRAHLDTLVQQGRLRRIIIGREHHLALGRGPRELIAVEEERGAAAPDPQTATVTQFQTQLKVDVETERLLLYRVGIVVVAILALVLVRAIGLDLLGY
jgi:hypothetical protein